MARPRTPLAKAELTGAAEKHPERFAGRSEPAGQAPLGEPSFFLDEYARQAWDYFRAELPWLTESDRAVLEIAAQIRGRQFKGEDVGFKALSLLRQILGQLGATPADKSKVAVPVKQETDPADEFLQ